MNKKQQQQLQNTQNNESDNIYAVNLTFVIRNYVPNLFSDEKFPTLSVQVSRHVRATVTPVFFDERGVARVTLEMIAPQAWKDGFQRKRTRSGRWAIRLDDQAALIVEQHVAIRINESAPLWKAHRISNGKAIVSLQSLFTSVYNTVRVDLIDDSWIDGEDVPDARLQRSSRNTGTLFIETNSSSLRLFSSIPEKSDYGEWNIRASVNYPPSGSYQYLSVMPFQHEFVLPETEAAIRAYIKYDREALRSWTPIYPGCETLVLSTFRDNGFFFPLAEYIALSPVARNSPEWWLRVFELAIMRVYRRSRSLPHNLATYLRFWERDSEQLIVALLYICMSHVVYASDEACLDHALARECRLTSPFAEVERFSSDLRYNAQGARFPPSEDCEGQCNEQVKQFLEFKALPATAFQGHPAFLKLHAWTQSWLFVFAVMGVTLCKMSSAPNLTANQSIRNEKEQQQEQQIDDIVGHGAGFLIKEETVMRLVNGQSLTPRDSRPIMIEGTNHFLLAPPHLEKSEHDSLLADAPYWNHLVSCDEAFFKDGQHQKVEAGPASSFYRSFQAFVIPEAFHREQDISREVGGTGGVPYREFDTLPFSGYFVTKNSNDPESSIYGVAFETMMAATPTLNPHSGNSFQLYPSLNLYREASLALIQSEPFLSRTPAYREGKNPSAYFMERWLVCKNALNKLALESNGGRTRVDKEINARLGSQTLTQEFYRENDLSLHDRFETVDFALAYAQIMDIRYQKRLEVIMKKSAALAFDWFEERIALGLDDFAFGGVILRFYFDTTQKLPRSEPNTP